MVGLFFGKCYGKDLRVEESMSWNGWLCTPSYTIVLPLSRPRIFVTACLTVGRSYGSCRERKVWSFFPGRWSICWTGSFRCAELVEPGPSGAQNLLNRVLPVCGAC
jgi:hypothetical protein